MHILLVVNPQAGHKKAQKIFPQIERKFSDFGMSFDTLFTECKGHGIKLIEQASLEKYDALVSVGGDGTLFEVLNGYFLNRRIKKPPLGIIPLGTGNAFVRDIGLLNFEWEKAIELIWQKRTKKVDVGFLKTENRVHYFINILGVGFVADVGATADKLKVFGELSYIFGVFHRLITLKTFSAHIEIDGHKIDRDVIFIEIANTRYTGSRFIMAPDAVFDDGKFDVVILKKTSRRRILNIFPTIFNGTHIEHDEVEVIKGSIISIKTDQPQRLIPDGEIFGFTPISIECLPGAIEIFSN